MKTMSQLDAEARNSQLFAEEFAEKAAKKNHNFLQIEKKTLKDMRRLVGSSVPAAQVIMLLGEKMNRANAVVCSFKTLSEITGYSRSTLAVAVKLLEAEKWLQVVKIGNANAYVINSAVFWQDTGDRKRRASFHATIIASESEQEDGYVERWKGVKLRSFPVIDMAADEQIVIAGDGDEVVQGELDV